MSVSGTTAIVAHELLEAPAFGYARDELTIVPRNSRAAEHSGQVTVTLRVSR